MGFIGGVLQQRFVERLSSNDRKRLLAVAIDVGKHQAAALVCDFVGQILAEPFTFELNERGFAEFERRVDGVRVDRQASWVRVGLEQAGHYHRPLLSRLMDAGLEVALLNPAQVKQVRAEALSRSLKSDERDLVAIGQLIIRGEGRGAEHPEIATATQAALVAHRARKVKARTALKNQVHGSLDLVFPGLSACFVDLLDTKVGRLLLAEGMEPRRVVRLGVERLRGFCLRRDVRVSRAKATAIVEAARSGLRLPEALASEHGRILAADVRLLGVLDEEIVDAERRLAEVLPSTPAAILQTIPRVKVVRASAYGGALGDPNRFATAAQVYRMSGLVPTLYSSAGRTRGGARISREGKVELRNAILELGKALRHGHPDFASYARSLESRGKPAGVIACALGHRANRVAFAMIRRQEPFDPGRWG